jgi:hypothetical protein
VVIIRFFSFLGFSDIYAITLPSIISCSLAVFPLFNIAKRVYGIREAWLAAVLYALHPGLLAYSILPGSNGILIFPLLMGIRLTLRTAFISKEEGDKTRFISHYAGSAILAISVGLSSRALPFLAVPLILAVKSAIRLRKSSAISETINGYLIGFAIWTIPFLLKFSISDLFLQNSQQLPIIQNIKIPFPERLISTSWGLFVYGQAPSIHNFLWLMVPLIFLILFLNGIRKTLTVKGKSHIAFFGIMLFFSALLSQNPIHPNSYGLVFPIIVLVAANGIPINSRFFRGFSIIIITFTAIIFIDRLLIIRNNDTALASMTRYINESLDTNETILLCGPSRRAIRIHNPELRVYQLESVKELTSPRYERMAANNKILYLSDIPQSEFSKENNINTVKSFNHLFLYEGKQPSLTIYERVSITP